MFGIDKKTLVYNLEKVRVKKCCCYSGTPDIPGYGSTCDCKYGVDINAPQCMTEHNGCPELRLARILLEAMTEEEYADLTKRAKVMIIT